MFEKEHHHYGRVTGLEVDLYSPNSVPMTSILKRVTTQQEGFSMPAAATTPKRKWSRGVSLGFGATTPSLGERGEVNTVSKNNNKTPRFGHLILHLRNSFWKQVLQEKGNILLFVT